jgi:hypothetical protein
MGANGVFDGAGSRGAAAASLRNANIEQSRVLETITLFGLCRLKSQRDLNDDSVGSNS